MTTDLYCPNPLIVTMYTIVFNFLRSLLERDELPALLYALSLIHI